MSAEPKKLDAVFEGGGVKGIAFVGAVEMTEASGYQFENVAGTSAGSILASFIAAGYPGSELKAIMEGLDYREFRDKGVMDRIPLIGPSLSLWLEKGIYEGDYFEDWLRSQLGSRGIRTFGDLVVEAYQDQPQYRYRLQVIAADVTRGRMLVLPKDIADYGINPDELEVARAVRMSISIPFFFEPVVLRHTSGETCYIVDGGLLSNYPVWIFDQAGGDPPWPTFGYKLVDPEEGRPNEIRGPLTLLAALFSTMMEAHDARYIDDHNFARTIPIPTLGVQATDFDISKERSQALYESGKQAAADFLGRWNFEAYKATFRQEDIPSRTDRLWGPR